MVGSRNTTAVKISRRLYFSFNRLGLGADFTITHSSNVERRMPREIKAMPPAWRQTALCVYPEFCEMSLIPR